MYMAALGSYL